MIEVIWPGLMLGLVGSLHCIGMCGPIAIALPNQARSTWSALAGRTLYNAGRVAAYALLGLAAGLIGEIVSLVDMQQWMSIAAGVLIIAAVLVPSKLFQRLIPGGLTGRIWQRVGRLTGGLFRSKSPLALLVIGVINGFLPCGLVYMAMAGAAATAGLTTAVSFMILFGLGTVPVMVATAMFGPLLGQKIRNRLVKLIPAGALVLAVLLILRGMSLGIPYISPNLSPAQQHSAETPSCCH